MDIARPAIAGALESSDCQVTVEKGEGKVEFSLESSVINQYGNQIRKVALETLENLEVKDVKLTIVDKGAFYDGAKKRCFPWIWGVSIICLISGLILGMVKF